MARTLRDLFQNEPLARQGGKTASEQYEIRDSKKQVQWSSSNPLIQNSGIQLANTARSRLGNRTEETLIEEETTGIRVVRAGSTPVIYGSELGRLTLGTTNTKDRMIQATYGEAPETDTGLLGDTVNSIRDGVDTLKSRLGFPNKAIPTYVAEQLNSGTYQLGLTQDRDRQLFEIKNEAQGGILGNFLQGTGGTPRDIGRNIIGNGIREVKDFVRESLLGLPQTSASPSGNSGYYVNTNNYYRTDFRVHSFTQDSAEGFSVTGINYGSISNPQGTGRPETLVDVAGDDRKLDKKGVKYSDPSNINPKSAIESFRNDLSDRQRLSEFDVDYRDIKYSKNVAIRKPKFDPTVIGKTRDIETDITKDSDFGIKTYTDLLNSSIVLNEDQQDFYDTHDFITLKFKSIPTGKVVYFRSTVSGLSETFSPSWDSSKFIGSPFSYYTYESIERTVSFNFKVFPLNALEHTRNWDRLNFLTSLVYPQGYYEGSTAVKPPLIEFTLGDMYNKKVSFIDSLSYTVDDTYPWNITDVENYVNEISSNGEKQVISKKMDGYKLPMIIDIQIGLTIIQSRGTTEEKKFYSFNPQNV